MATLPVLPVMYGFSITKKPVFQTIVQSFRSGREVTVPQQTTPLWEFELKYETLKDQTQNSIPYDGNLGSTAFMDLSEIFTLCNGQYGRFVYDDLSDNSRVSQQVGVGDGVTKDFPIVETIADATTGLKFSQTIGHLNLNHAVKVYFDGIEVPSSGNWTTDAATETVLEFVSAPSMGVVITMDFFFYYLCRFIADDQEFEQFVKNWWTTSIKFRSINTDPGFPVHGAHWVFYPLTGGSGGIVQIDPANSIAGNTLAVGDVITTPESANGATFDIVNKKIASQVTGPQAKTIFVATNHAGTIYVGETAGNVIGDAQAFYYNGSFHNLNGGDNFVKVGTAGISPDGTVGCGSVYLVASGERAQPCYWPLSGDNVPYVLLPTLGSPGASAGEALAIGADNNTIVGTDDPSGVGSVFGQAVRWDIGANTETILAGPAGYDSAQAYGISLDMTLIFGRYRASSAFDSWEACYWTGPTITTLPSPNTGSFHRDEIAYGCSTDNSVIVGNYTRFSGGSQACVWRNGVVENMPDPSQAGFSDAVSIAWDITDDGNTVIGVWSGNGGTGIAIWKYETF